MKSKLNNTSPQDDSQRASGEIKFNNGVYDIILHRGDEFYGDMEYHLFSLTIKLDGCAISARKYDHDDYVSLYEIGLEEKGKIEAMRKLMQSLFNVSKLQIFVREGEKSGYHKI